MATRWFSTNCPTYCVMNVLPHWHLQQKAHVMLSYICVREREREREKERIRVFAKLIRLSSPIRVLVAMHA